MKVLFALAALAAAAHAKVTSAVLRELEVDGTTSVIVTFKKEATESLATYEAITNVAERREKYIAATSAEAIKRTSSLREALGTKADIESFWIAPVASVKNVDQATVDAISKLPNVLKVDKVRSIKLTSVIKGKENSPTDHSRPNGIQWGVDTVGAPAIWKYFDGKGVVVGSIDTGVRHTHEAIKSKWRADRGWYDPYNQTALPEDLGGHGTHTIGTMVGDYGIGVAPGAQFIACRGLYIDSGDDLSLLKCAQFMVCPTKPDGSDPDCTKGADLVNNSWGGDASTDTWFADVIDSWHMAGVTPLFANGNEGPACATAGNPASYKNVLSVGAVGSYTDEPNQLAYFSSKGPAQYKDWNGNVHTIVKPDVSAPGFFTYSALNVNDAYYEYYAGTSMATPHVAGVVALLKSAQKGLTYNQIYRYLTTTTVKDILQPEPKEWILTRNRTLPGAPNCGGVSDKAWPNNRYGYGRVNVTNILAGGKFPNPSAC
ncbi:hypothetical protein SPRG_16241 [Saprolegnia parasitica CBS 223.65]|uniref:subtilisin n=1 Tax=Saprolegnia parasitica (strain CBS 223.65) TaxID=695850 RepID=A0A067BUJ5_SAPPC|nr:hypothetical protein SPRG_16241 [Saprolegnia parasitica CBS 223.65]KDO18277.1 hypothetical protein SPRG_16241 [Saprolegnia parasitica CBS 223.65]|eukprot:XP_012211016.1 hypothetical protein SPRG_16241 [Saprolegnia parasitica CBS 223.65]